VNKEVGLALPENAGLTPVNSNEETDAAQISDETAEDPLE
jgi:hypothetical protein